MCGPLFWQGFSLGQFALSELFEFLSVRPCSAATQIVYGPHFFFNHLWASSSSRGRKNTSADRTFCLLRPFLPCESVHYFMSWISSLESKSPTFLDCPRRIGATVDSFYLFLSTVEVRMQYVAIWVNHFAFEHEDLTGFFCLPRCTIKQCDKGAGTQENILLISQCMYCRTPRHAPGATIRFPANNNVSSPYGLQNQRQGKTKGFPILKAQPLLKVCFQREFEISMNIWLSSVSDNHSCLKWCKRFSLQEAHQFQTLLAVSNDAKKKNSTYWWQQFQV